MKQSILAYLICPKCGADFSIQVETQEQGIKEPEIIRGHLECHSGHRFSVIRGIPRFVEYEAYVESFGIQWNRYPKTQRDSVNGTGIFRKRFQNVTGWSFESLKGCLVLDAGCGPGSFVDVVAPHCGEIVAVDLSAAVEACFQNDGMRANVHVVQADIFNLPFKKMAFDRVYSIGVIQHTPSPKKALSALCGFVKQGGQIAFWGYDFKLSYFVSPRFIMRLLVSRLSPKTSEKFLSVYTPAALKLRRRIRSVPLIGKVLEKGVFVTEYSQKYPELSQEQLDEWAFMDTYDALATKYEIRLPVRDYRKVLAAQKFRFLELRKDGTGPAIVASREM